MAGRHLLIQGFAAAAVATYMADRFMERPNEDQARLCRLTLPALEPAGARLGIVRMAQLTRENSVRIDYRVERDAEHPVRHFAICRFTEAAKSRTPQMTEIVTQTGPLAGPTLYLMKRYYLGTPESAAADPG